MRIGIAGLRRGQSFLRVFEERSDCEVSALCDTDEDVLNEVGNVWKSADRYDTFDSLLDADVDVLVVSTPGPLHADQAIAALDSGKHVLSEVPAAWSLESCHALVEAVERTDVVYSLAENMCYFHYLVDWKSRIRAGEIGQVTYAEAEYIHDCSARMHDGNWRKEMPPIYYCTHSLGPVLEILDDRCTQAIGLSTGSRTHPELGVHDMEVALFQTERGVPVKILCGFAICRDPAFHWQVFYGTEGVIENGRPPDDSAKMFQKGNRSMREIEADVSDPDLKSAATGGHGTSEMLLVDDYLKAVRGEGPNRIDVYKGLEMSAPGICAHESALKGGIPVEIPDFRAGQRSDYN